MREIPGGKGALIQHGNIESHAFDTIVVGVNASSARPDFVSATPRLYDFARNGGTLIVQYQQQDYVQRNLPPFPAQMAARVADETAPVTILAPDHPVFTTPNKIGTDDFSGWIQDRNLSAFTTFDPTYVSLPESHDPGSRRNRAGGIRARWERVTTSTRPMHGFGSFPRECPAHTGCLQIS